MGFLSSAESVVARAMAAAMMPPPPPDITRWCEDNIIFDERSPMPGPFNIGRFPFLAEIHVVLSPEHPAREVTVRGSAQWGKTVSVIQPCVAAWHEYTPLDSLVVHPTQSAATEWVDNKWLPMRRQAPGLKAIFGDGRGGDNKDSKFNQETLDRNGSLKVASAGSPSDLTGTSRRLVVLDDLSKFDMTDKGDPEALAISRASGFEDAKILRVSTPLIKGTCRITRSFDRSDQRYYHLPCPHCGHEAPLTWENFKANIDPERLHAACFSCESCGCIITHGDKERIVGLGKWVAHNPRGDHPGFHLWRAYAPQRDWASIAVEYAQVMGWTRLEVSESSEDAIAKAVEAETEQTFYNDVLGLPYEQATDAPDWEALRNRTENAPDGIGRGILPAKGFIYTAGVDCQDDRIEVQLVAFGANRKRWVIDYKVIPHHISDDDGRAALDAILKAEWRTQTGAKFALDMLAIDGGTYTDDVWSWAKRHPWTRVMIVKGSSTGNGPVLQPQKLNRRNDGKAKRQQKRAFMLNVSQLKGEFYTWLRKEDGDERGHCAFARGLGDEYYRQVTGEVRVLKRATSGVMTSAWVPVPGVRNEALDTMNYAEAAARRKGWTSLTDDQWDLIEAERTAVPVEPQADLFDASVPMSAAAGVVVAADAPAAEKRADRPKDENSDWLGGRGAWQR
jgi:phage terminase large subunit GpA-like protein